MDKNDIAVEEWKQLESVIQKYDDIRLRLNGWLIALLSAFLVAVFTDKFELSIGTLVTLPIAVILFFYIAETCIGVGEARAIVRKKYVERCLRQGDDYDGPRVSESLEPTRDYKILIPEAAKEFLNATAYLPKLMVGIIIVILLLAK
ncbi:hypothetical protein [Desulfobacter curvatus]|uniref:hypothetical protein n=1 Tax=Desulfobacter curvatus TaxID=2290 RepID=UPI0003662890|nr:hypothetical protein [Desulfobacter curvatus]